MPTNEIANHWDEFFLGAIVVTALCARRFNFPGPIRTHTTFSRYHAGLITYIVVGVTIYNLIFFLLRASPYSFVASPMFAVVVQLLLWRLPGTSQVDEFWREKLYLLIGYPGEGQRLASLISQAPLNPPDDVLNDVKHALAQRGYDSSDDWLPAAKPVRESWHQSAILFEQLRRWEGDADYQHFLRVAWQDFNVLRQRYDQLSIKVVGVLHAIERLGTLLNHPGPDETSGNVSHAGFLLIPPEENLETIRKTVNFLLADLKDQVTFFHARLCHLIARGVLTVSITASQRERQLLKLGVPGYVRSYATSGLLTWAFLFYLMVFILFLGLPSLIVDPKPERLLYEMVRVTMIALVQVTAVACAILPKNSFGFANEDNRGRTPWGFVVGAGLAAAIIAIPVELPFLYLMGRSLLSAIPWLVMPFTTGAVLAFLIQDSRWKGTRSNALRRTWDSIVLVLFTMISLYIALELTSLIPQAQQTVSSVIPKWYQPAAAILISIGIGSFVPAYVREAPVPLKRHSGWILDPVT